jgi:hypothetical protein
VTISISFAGDEMLCRSFHGMCAKGMPFGLAACGTLHPQEVFQGSRGSCAGAVPRADAIPEAKEHSTRQPGTSQPITAFAIPPNAPKPVREAYEGFQRIAVVCDLQRRSSRRARRGGFARSVSFNPLDATYNEDLRRDQGKSRGGARMLATRLSAGVLEP